MKALQRLSILTLISLGMFGLCVAMRAEAGDKTIPEHYPAPPTEQTQSQSVNLSATANASATGTGGNVHQEMAASSAVAPVSYPTSPCRIAGSAGLQIMKGGISLGGSKLDEGCDQRELARAFASIGRADLALKVLCAQASAQKVLGASCADPLPTPASKMIAAPAPPVVAVCPDAKGCPDFKGSQQK